MTRWGEVARLTARGGDEDQPALALDRTLASGTRAGDFLLIPMLTLQVVLLGLRDCRAARCER